MYAYDIKNGKELLKLEEIDEANSINHDYTYNIRDDLLIVESSYNVNPISINSIGYFKTNTNKEANLDWQKIQFNSKLSISKKRLKTSERSKVVMV